MEARNTKNFGVIGTVLFLIGFILYFYFDSLILFQTLEESLFIYEGVLVIYTFFSIILIAIGVILLGKAIKSISKKMNNTHMFSDYTMFVVLFILATSLRLIAPYFPMMDFSYEAYYFVIIILNIIMWVLLFVSASSINGCFELLTRGSRVSIFKNSGYLWVLGTGLYALFGFVQLLFSLFLQGFIYLQIFALLILVIAIIVQIIGFYLLPDKFEIYTKSYYKMVRQNINIFGKNDTD